MRVLDKFEATAPWVPAFAGMTPFTHPNLHPDFPQARKRESIYPGGYGSGSPLRFGRNDEFRNTDEAGHTMRAL